LDPVRLRFCTLEAIKVALNGREARAPGVLWTDNDASVLDVCKSAESRILADSRDVLKMPVFNSSPRLILDTLKMPEMLIS
jgi:hypothetical protein